ncbi:MAG: hypothetical protein EHM79_10305 [Geobacter sp.]|nr:MAG: hypothetical protein EHM79_10305 [Geobacter sp.]
MWYKIPEVADFQDGEDLGEEALGFALPSDHPQLELFPFWKQLPMHQTLRIPIYYGHASRKLEHSRQTVLQAETEQARLYLHEGLLQGKYCHPDSGSR